MKKVHDGLQDGYMMAAVAARSMVGVFMAQPMTPLTRSTATGRKGVYCMMPCLGSYIDGLGNLEQGALAVAAAPPHLKAGVYGPWWASVGADF